MVKHPASIAETDEPEEHVKRCHEYVCECQILDQLVRGCVEPLVVMNGDHHSGVVGNCIQRVVAGLKLQIYDLFDQPTT